MVKSSIKHQNPNTGVEKQELKYLPSTLWIHIFPNPHACTLNFNNGLFHLKLNFSKTAILFYLLASLVSFSIYAQDAETEFVTGLNSILLETSGLLNIEGRLVTNNDSGGAPVLYEIDSVSGNITRQVFILGANNVDWEDLAQNDNYIFIADIGNNNGDRQDLRIYRIEKSEYLDSANDTVSAEQISFTYEDQVNFNPSPFTTNFDAEALIEFNNQLYIFSKNWGNQKTRLYQIPNEIGTQTAILKDSLDVQGLISAAESSPDKILLCGYTLSHAFVYSLSEFPGDNFFDGNVMQYILPGIANVQVEGLTRNCGDYFFISTEGNQFIEAQLFRLLISATTGIKAFDENSLVLYPNPAQAFVNIDFPGNVFIEIFNEKGQLILSSNEKLIPVAELSRGSYCVQIRTANEVIRKKLILE